MYPSRTNLQTLTKSSILLYQALHRYIRKYRPHSKALKIHGKTHSLASVPSGDNYFTSKKVPKCLYIYWGKKKSKGNIIQEQNNFLLFLWLENKLNDFECSWVLVRDTSLLDWQRKWYPLIPLSLREGTSRRASNGKWEQVQSTLWHLKCPVNHGPVSLQHDLKGFHLVSVFPHTFSPNLPTEMANYYSDIKPVGAQ